jgi:hypothetical protein
MKIKIRNWGSLKLLFFPDAVTMNSLLLAETFYT